MKLLRAYARRLVIANWRGVVFHCFDLDRHVTGLEGQNGSGKTTVMAAFVTAILPNKRLLAFKKIDGGSPPGRGDCGLWGRLGEEGVSYSMIEWITPRGQSVWAGVEMLRGAAPSIDMKHFIIEDLVSDASAHKVLLIRQGKSAVIPQLSQLRDHVTLQGGRLTSYKNLGDYMKALYDRGITPMPMTNQEEQERFYRVLSTSMEGSALSSLVRTGLRDYLLSADLSLERRTVLMRETLDECRKTKRELELAERAHAEISELFDSAWKMASYALFGALGRYEQEVAKWREDAVAGKALNAQYARDSETVALLDRAVHALAARLGIAKSNLVAADEDLHLKLQAEKVRVRLETACVKRDLLRQSWKQADLERADSAADEQRANDAHMLAQHQYSSLAEELGNTQKAYEGLIRRVVELNFARERLLDAQAAMRPRHVDRFNALPLKFALDQRYEKATRLQTDAQSEYDASDNQRARFEKLYVCACNLAVAQGEPPPATNEAHAYALILANRLRKNGAGLQNIARLESELIRARSTAQQQRQLREQAAKLGIGDSADLIQALALVHKDSVRYEQEQASIEAALAARHEKIIELSGKLPELKEAVRVFQLANDVRLDLLALDGDRTSIDTAEDLRKAVRAGRGDLGDVDMKRRDAESNIRLLRDRIRQLENCAGTLDIRIGGVAEHVNGVLLSERFDDLSAQEAAVTQARLGTWVDAIVVDTPEHAARLASELEDRPETLLFLSEQAALRAREGTTLKDSELVIEGKPGQGIARLTRRPDHPLLGRRARAVEAGRLKADVEQLEKQLSEFRDRARVLQQSMELLHRWLALGNAAWTADPGPGLKSLQAEMRTSDQAIADLETRRNSMRDMIAGVRVKRRQLAELETRGGLLDPPLWTETVALLHSQLRAAQSARDWVEMHGENVQSLLDGAAILDLVPDAVRHRRLERAIEKLKLIRNRLSHRRDALGSVLRVVEHLDREEDERNYLEQSSVIEGLSTKLGPAKDTADTTLREWNAARTVQGARQQRFSMLGGELEQKIAECAALQTELADTGGTGTKQEVDLSRQDLARASLAVELVTKERETAISAHVRAEALLGELADKRQAKKDSCSQQLSVLRFERRARRELLRVVKVLGLHGRIDSESNRLKYLSVGNPIAIFQLSQKHQGMLLQQLRPFPELLETLRGIDGFFDASGERRAIQTLHAWHRVRLHIQLRIPRNLASADDPQVALAQMTEKIGELRRTLEAQEDDMRSRSSGLADGISVRQRSARALVTRLNKELEQVSFGSIRGLSIKPTQPPDMEKMLACLKGDGQLSLLDSASPLEESLARLYLRETGGNIQGIKLLDYRNYLRLHLEVQRLNGNWEATDGLSTGEAIGVGAAVLIMILRTWNEEANRISGSAGYAMQQILLDEANRLDTAALDTLVEFCQRMDVQALVAAPGLDKPRRSTVFQLQRSLRGQTEFVTIRGSRMSV